MKTVLKAFTTWMVKSGEASSKCYYNNKRAYYIWKMSSHNKIQSVQG